MDAHICNFTPLNLKLLCLITYAVDRMITLEHNIHKVTYKGYSG